MNPLYNAFGFYRDMGRQVGSDWRRLVTRMEGCGLDIPSSRVLDIGCGNFYPYVILFHQIAKSSIGVDLLPLHRLAGPGRWRWHTQSHSAQLRRNMRDTYFRHVYHSSIASAAGIRIERQDVNLCRADAAWLPLPDRSIDLVVSRAAFEHIAHPEATVAAIARVLRPGGLVDVTIHLFTSLSGGHEQDFWDFRRRSRPTLPWAHLRSRHWQAPLFLNRLHESDYRAAFETHLEIVDWWTDEEEGAEFINDQVLLEVGGLTREDLVKKMVTIVARKHK